MTTEIMHAVLLSVRDIVVTITGVIVALDRYEAWRERRGKRLLVAAAAPPAPENSIKR